MATVTMSDFFWGCIGFYEGVRHNEPFQQTDMNIFIRVDRPEFEVSTSQLKSLLQLPVLSVSFFLVVAIIPLLGRVAGKRTFAAFKSFFIDARGSACKPDF